MSDSDFDWYGPDAATFGDRVAGAREVAGLSQDDLAHKLGVRLETVIAWEDDRDEPRANKMALLAGLLNVSLTWLLTGVGDGGAVELGEDFDVPASTLRPLLSELIRLRGDLASAEARVADIERRVAAALGEGKR